MHWLTPQMAKWLEMGWSDAKSLELLSDDPAKHVGAGAKLLDHLPLPSQACQQGAALEVEQHRVQDVPREC